MPPTRTSNHLHAAIQAGAWSTAQELLATFRQEVEETWRAAKTDQERRVISQEVTGFLEWARAMTLTSRAQAASKLKSLSRQRAYSVVSLPNPHRGVSA